MNEKELFINAIETLYDSWGSDTPSEVVWGINKLLEWYESEYDVELNVELNEPLYYEENIEEVIEVIRNS